MEQKNAELTSQLARKALGLPEDADLADPNTFPALRQQLDQHYEPIRNLESVKPDDDFFDAIRSAIPSQNVATKLSSDKQIAQAVRALANKSQQGWTGPEFLEELRRLRGLSNDYFAKASAPTVADSTRISNMALGKAYKQLNDAMEGLAERHPDLSPVDLLNYRSARARLARSFDYEKAITPEGYVDSAKLAKYAGSAADQDPNTSLIVNTYRKFPKSVSVPKPGFHNDFSRWDALIPAAGILGHYTPLPFVPGLGHAAMGLEAARLGLRFGLPTGIGQRLFARPNSYTPGLGVRLPAAIMRPGLAAIPAEEAGRDFFEDQPQQ